MSLTPNQFADQLREGLRQIQTNNRPLQLAAYSALANMDERIFYKGQDASEGKIGDYNTTTPIYIDPLKSPRKTPVKGKNGNATFKDGKPHKTSYFESYKAYRDAIGRRTDTVVLDLSSDLRLDMENPQGGVPTPERIHVNEYRVSLKRDYNIKKKDGLEKKYGVIFRHSPGEVDKFLDVLEKELALIFTP